MLNQVTTILNGVSGLFLALAALLSGIASILQAWRRVRIKKIKGPIESESVKVKKGKNTIGFATLGVALIMISSTIFVFRVNGDSNISSVLSVQPLNVRLTTAAWSAFNMKDYRIAISKAAECINGFQGAANREEAELKGQGAPYPSTGKASSEEKTVIFAHGLLNDVATCFFIQGRASEYLGLIEDAKRAYHQASTYSYARTWDLNGEFFWSPAQASIDRLSMLK